MRIKVYARCFSVKKLFKKQTQFASKHEYTKIKQFHDVIFTL